MLKDARVVRGGFTHSSNNESLTCITGWMLLIRGKRRASVCYNKVMSSGVKMSCSAASMNRLRERSASLSGQVCEKCAVCIKCVQLMLVLQL